MITLFAGPYICHLTIVVIKNKKLITTRGDFASPTCFIFPVYVDQSLSIIFWINSVVAKETPTYAVGDTITMRLMKREKGSIIVQPYDPAKQDNQPVQLYNIKGKCDDHMAYTYGIDLVLACDYQKVPLYSYDNEM